MRSKNSALQENVALLLLSYDDPTSFEEQIISTAISFFDADEMIKLDMTIENHSAQERKHKLNLKDSKTLINDLLEFAVIYNKFDLLITLVKEKNARYTEKKNTLLHLAAYYCRENIIEYILTDDNYKLFTSNEKHITKKDFINSTTSSTGETALHVSLDNSFNKSDPNQKAIEQLLEHGADINSYALGSTALVKALAIGHPSFFTMLEKETATLATLHTVITRMDSVLSKTEYLAQTLSLQNLLMMHKPNAYQDVCCQFLKRYFKEATHQQQPSEHLLLRCFKHPNTNNSNIEIMQYLKSYIKRNLAELRHAKEIILHYILNIADKKTKLTLLSEAMTAPSATVDTANPNPLSRFFWANRSARKPSLERGTLKKIKDAHDTLTKKTPNQNQHGITLFHNENSMPKITSRSNENSALKYHGRL